MSADCNEGKARIVNHLFGSAPLNPETAAAQTKNICSKGPPCALGFGSRSGIFLQRSHDRDDHYTGTRERAARSRAFKQKARCPPNSSACLVARAGSHPTDGKHTSRQADGLTMNPVRLVCV